MTNRDLRSQGSGTDRRGRVAHGVSGTAIALALALGSHQAQAQPAEAGLLAQTEPQMEAQAQPRDFVIPAQPLTSALVAFGDQAGLQITADTALLTGHTAPALSGRMAPAEALARLLAGSGLTWRAIDAGTMVLEPAAMPSGQDEGAPLRLDGIVVQGEKLFRTLRQTPASTVVIPGFVADVPQNRDLREAIEAVPNVYAPESFNAPAIRGIDGNAGQAGGAALSTGAQPRVNIIVDGVPRPYTISSVPTLNSTWDLDTVEVARGPQSTTTGRNSLGGAIRVLTNDPVFDLEAAARTGYFNQDGTIAGAVMANVPLIDDQVALRVTGEVSDGDTFVEVTDPALSPGERDEAEEEQFRRFRGKLLVTPAALPGLEVLMQVERTVAQRQFSPGLVDNADVDTLSIFAEATSIDDNEQMIYSGRIRYALSDHVELEGRAAFLDNSFVIPNITTLFDFEQSTETLVAEGLVRLRDVGPLSTGVFGLAFERQADEAINRISFFPFGVDAEVINYGIFGEGEFPLTDRLTLIAGGRVEIDRRQRLVTLGGAGTDTEVDEVAFIPKAGLRYDLSDQVVVGYTYAEGYRPGGVDFDLFEPVAGVVSFESERLRQHEVYARTTWLDDRLTVNGSAFFYTFTDAHTGGAQPGLAGDLGLFGNVPRARGYGLELDGAYEVVDGLTLSLGLGLLNTRVTDPGPFLSDADGEELPRAPSVTATGGLSYVSPFGVDASISARYAGESTLSLGDDPIDGFLVADMAVGYEFDLTDRLSGRIDAFVENIADNRYIIDRSNADTVALARPRTVGVSATFRF